MLAHYLLFIHTKKGYKRQGTSIRTPIAQIREVNRVVYGIQLNCLEV